MCDYDEVEAAAHNNLSSRESGDLANVPRTAAGRQALSDMLKYREISFLRLVGLYDETAYHEKKE